MRRTVFGFALGVSLLAATAPAIAEPPLFRSEIEAAAQRHGVPVELVEAIIRVESDGNPWAVSRSGARGLMQLMPGTAAILGVRDSFDPRQNIDAGVRHLTTLIEQFDQLPLVLAAYNAGAGAVTAYGGIPPFPETRSYVARVLQLFTELSRRAEETVWQRPVEAPRAADVLPGADPRMPPITRAELERLVRFAGPD